MINNQNISNKLDVLTLSDNERNYAQHIIRFFKKESRVKHSAGYKGPMYRQIEKYVSEHVDKFDDNVLESTLNTLYSHSILHSRDLYKKLSNRHFTLNSSFH